MKMFRGYMMIAAAALMSIGVAACTGESAPPLQPTTGVQIADEHALATAEFTVQVESKRIADAKPTGNIAAHVAQLVAGAQTDLAEARRLHDAGQVAAGAALAREVISTMREASLVALTGVIR